MKFTAERGDMFRALNHVTGIVAKRNIIEILANVWISAHADGRVLLRSTNLDMEAAASFPADVDTPGTITTPNDTLLNIVKNTPNGADITLALDGPDPRVSVKSGRSRFRLPVLHEDMFPSIPNVIDPVSVDLPGTVLGSLLGRVSFAVGHEETRHYLMGVYVHTHADQIRFVAVDGHRLALAIGPEVSGEIEGAIMPTDFVAHAERLLRDYSDPVRLSVSESMVSVTLGETVLTSKRISGAYDQYQEDLPKGNIHTLSMGREALEMAIRRVSAVGSRRAILEIKGDVLTVSGKSDATSEGADEIVAEFDGEAYRGAFNVAYLLDILSHTTGDILSLQVNTGRDAVIAVAPNDPTTTYVLMPQRA